MKFLSDILAKAGLTVDGVVTLNNTATGQTPNANDNSTKLATTAWVRTFVQPYSLPIATSSVLGGIKVGTGLSIDAGTGVLSVSGGGAASIKSTQTFTATAGQTVFTISGGYIVGLIDVFLNGVYLSPNQTTATNGTTITLADAALAGDIIDVIIASPVYQGATTTTDQLSEGSTNLYFTNARARAAISESVTGLDYNSATGVLSITTGYGIPTTASQTTWDAAYNDKINSAAVTGTTTKTLTLTQQDGGTITASWTDDNTDAVTSVFGRTGAVVATSGDYTTALVTEVTNLYYTDARARAAISVTGSGSYDSATGIITVTGGVTSVNTLTGAVTLTTTNIGEGTNLYYTTARANSDFDTRLGTKSTTNLAEGTNLYYTTARANSDFDTRLATKSTTNLAEGTNLYYTDTRVGTYLTGNSYATQSYVSTQINNLVSGAPGLLDTLDELAAALGDDPNFATTVSTALGNRLRIDIGTQGLTGTQQGYGRTNLGLGSLSTLSSIGDAYITDVAYSKLTGVPSTFAPSAHTHDDRYYTETEIGNFFSGASVITGYNKTNWDTAYGWGNHASGGYLTTASAASTYVSLSGSYANPSWITSLAYSKITGVPAFITSYTEVDTLATVTARGATTSTTSIFTGGLQARKNQTDNNYTTAALWTESFGTTTTGIAFHISGVVGKFLEMRTNGTLYWENNQVWTSGTLTNLNQLTNGPGYITSYSETDTLASVTGRGATTSTSITAGGIITAGTGQGFKNLSYQGGYNRIWSFGSGSEAYGIAYYQGATAPGGSDAIGFHFGNTATPLFYANNYGNANFTGTISASNFSGTHSGSSSGTNTGDQTNISGTAAYATQWGTAAGYANFSSTAISASVGWLFGTTGNGIYAPVSLASVATLLSLSSYLPLSGGVVSSTVTINGGAVHPLAISSGQRYQLQVRNTNNSINSVYGWWWFMDTNFNMGFHADGASDRFTLTRDGNLSVSGTLSGSNLSGTNTGDQTNISGTAGSETLATVTSRGASTASGITFTAPGGTVLLKHAVSEADSWIFQENAANWGLYWKNAPTGNHTFGGYTTVGAELFGMSAANSSGNGVTTTNFVGATSAIAQWMISNFTGYIWSASTIYAQTSMVVGGNTVLHAGNFSSYATPIRTQSNWNDSTVIGNVVGLMAWKNYGNSHVIFDASQGVSPSGGGVSQTNATTAWAASYPTLMGWNGSGTYGVRVDSARVSDNTTGTASNITAYTINQNLGTGNSPSFAGLTINTGGTGTWGPFVVTSTSQWGDGGTQYVTIGAGGAAGIMINNPHIVWNASEAAAVMKFGRSGGISSGSYYNIGTGASNNFFINKDGAIASPILNINSSGNATFSGTITASNFSGASSGTNTGDQTNISGSSATVTHYASRADGTSYNVVWAAGNPSHMYSCDAVRIQSSTGTLFATRSAAPMSATVANGNWNTSFSNTPVSTMAWGGDISSGGPTGTWWFQMNMRHSNASNDWGTQLAYGWEDNANQIYQRNVTGGNWSGWVRYLNSGNYSSYALPLSGGTLSGTLSFAQPVGLGFANGQYIKDNGSGGLIINSGAAVNIGGTAVTFSGTTYAYNGIQMYRNGSASTGISWYNASYYNWQEYMASAGATGCGPNGNLTAPGGLYQVSSWALRSRMEGVGSYGWLWEVSGGGGGSATASSVMELDVYGNLRLSADVVAYASDGRLKTNVKVIENAISKVQAIRGVEYDWLENIYEDYGFKPTKMHEVGVIAQEVELVLPEVVLTAPFNGAYKDKHGIDPNFLTVKYDKMVPLLIEAIKEQQGQIESQKSEIDELKGLVQQLINR